jgi:hypothetical protein
MTKHRLLTPAEEMELLREVLAAEGDDDRRAHISEKMLTLHWQQQRAATEQEFVIHRGFNRNHREG